VIKRKHIVETELKISYNIFGMSYYINLSILSNEQKDIHRAERQKILSTEARRILSVCEGRPITEDDIAKEADGRPFFPNRDTDFSISHSGALTAVSLVNGENLRTSCDVELVRPRKRAKEIAEEFFSVHERDYIEAGGHFNETRFYEIWTLKECFLKLNGLSVLDMANTPSFISGEGEYTFDFVGSSPISFNLYELTGNGDEHYVLAAAIEGTGEYQPEIRWFSPDSLELCNKILNQKVFDRNAR
jgi:phosphopantetheinyl transferase